jgi:hypothetical protein
VYALAQHPAVAFLYYHISFALFFALGFAVIEEAEDDECVLLNMHESAGRSKTTTT